MWVKVLSVIVDQRGVLPLPLLIGAALLLSVATGAGVYMLKDQELDDLRRENAGLKARLGIHPSPSPSPGSGMSSFDKSVPEPNAEAAQLVVKKFVLAVADPSVAPTPEKRRAAVAHLTPRLQADVNQKFGGDPLGTLGLQNVAQFDVALPEIKDGKATVNVTFKFPQPVSATLILVQQNGTWLIDEIQPAK